MKGLKIIPLFTILLLLSYVGVVFVGQNPQEVVVKFGSRATAPTALGFVVLTSILAGMIFAGILCSIELVVLYMQNQKMRRKLFPRNPTAGGSGSSTFLSRKFTEDLNDDIEERLRQSGEPKDETTGSHQP